MLLRTPAALGVPLMAAGHRRAMTGLVRAHGLHRSAITSTLVPTGGTTGRSSLQLQQMAIASRRFDGVHADVNPCCGHGTDLT